MVPNAILAFRMRPARRGKTTAIDMMDTPFGLIRVIFLNRNVFLSGILNSTEMTICVEVDVREEKNLSMFSLLPDAHLISASSASSAAAKSPNGEGANRLPPMVAMFLMAGPPTARATGLRNARPR